MNLTDIIRSAVERLPPGEHETGLRSVVTHIERAIVNLERGQQDADDEWYRDAIYRCNQAFEGSVKEAYRVLAGGDPTKKSPFEIEQYIEQNNVLRDRVLKQLVRFRKEWRNPSTHDYNLDFDENEAFLAVVSVCAFAKVLVNEIALKLAYDATSQASSQPISFDPHASFAEEVADNIGAVFTVIGASTTDDERLTEVHWLGSLAGYLDAVEGIEAQVEVSVPGSQGARADMIARRGDQVTVVELKRHRRRREVVDSAKRQLASYMSALRVEEGVLAFFDEKALNYQVDSEIMEGVRLYIVRPTSN